MSRIIRLHTSFLSASRQAGAFWFDSTFVKFSFVVSDAQLLATFHSFCVICGFKKCVKIMYLRDLLSRSGHPYQQV